MVYDKRFIIDCKRFILEEDYEQSHYDYALGVELLHKVWAVKNKGVFIVYFMDIKDITRNLKFRKSDLACISG